MDYNQDQKTKILNTINVLNKFLMRQKITLFSFWIGLFFIALSFISVFMHDQPWGIPLIIVLFLISFGAMVIASIFSTIMFFTKNSLLNALDQIEDEELKQNINKFKNSLIRSVQYYIFLVNTTTELIQALKAKINQLENDEVDLKK